LEGKIWHFDKNMRAFYSTNFINKNLIQVHNLVFVPVQLSLQSQKDNQKLEVQKGKS
jgi:hypothetical protein